MIHPEFYAERPSHRLVRARHLALALLLPFTFAGAASSQQPAPTPNLQEPINIESTAIEYVPPLAQSVLSRDQGQVSNLLRAGENPDDRVRGKDGARAGFTPLILVAAISDAEIAQMLIRAGAKITASDDFHRSAFWYAALRGDVQLTKVLVEVPGAKEAVNLTDDDLKRAPLHMAVHGNKPELVQILLRTGASTALKDYLEETPIEFCKRRFTKGCAGLER